ncbi:hypothetical protein F4805DRAFT_462851 [Annulohypoxylon moriforme]|nr:hypothetical protein F4805DRAFT_462851 [Annulohypoxylon moriforme]
MPPRERRQAAGLVNPDYSLPKFVYRVMLCLLSPVIFIFFLISFTEIGWPRRHDSDSDSDDSPADADRGETTETQTITVRPVSPRIHVSQVPVTPRLYPQSNEDLDDDLEDYELII